MAARWMAGVALAAMALTATGAAAGPIQARYQVTLAGLSLGVAELAGTVDGEGYSLTLNAQLSGLAGAVTSGQGNVAVAGQFAGQRVISRGYGLRAANRDMARTIQIGLAGGQVTAVAIEPPFDPRPDRTPLRAEHKRGVVDPVSAMVMPAHGSPNPLDPAQCERVLPVFDGVQRFDITLSYRETRMVRGGAGQYAGPVLVCDARYRPLGGHLPSPSTSFMTNNRDMQVWLAPVADAPVLVPYRIHVRTPVGTTVITQTAARGLAAPDLTASIRR